MKWLVVPAGAGNSLKCGYQPRRACPAQEEEMNRINELLSKSEEGHAYAYGGGSILALVLLVILLIWLF